MVRLLILLYAAAVAGLQTLSLSPVVQARACDRAGSAFAYSPFCSMEGLVDQEWDDGNIAPPPSAPLPLPSQRKRKGRAAPVDDKARYADALSCPDDCSCQQVFARPVFALPSAPDERRGTSRDMGPAQQGKVDKAAAGTAVAPEEGGDGEPWDGGDAAAAATRQAKKSARDSPAGKLFDGFRDRSALNETIMILCDENLRRFPLDYSNTTLAAAATSRLNAFLQLHSDVCTCGELHKAVSHRTVSLVDLNATLNNFQLPTFQCSKECPIALLAGSDNGKFEVPLHALGFAPPTPLSPTQGFSYKLLEHFITLRQSSDVSGTGTFCLPVSAVS